MSAPLITYRGISLLSDSAEPGRSTASTTLPLANDHRGTGS
jgi:hypothetical protein